MDKSLRKEGHAMWKELQKCTEEEEKPKRKTKQILV